MNCYNECDTCAPFWCWWEGGWWMMLNICHWSLYCPCWLARISLANAGKIWLFPLSYLPLFISSIDKQKIALLEHCWIIKSASDPKSLEPTYLIPAAVSSRLGIFVLTHPTRSSAVQFHPVAPIFPSHQHPLSKALTQPRLLTDCGFS